MHQDGRERVYDHMHQDGRERVYDHMHQDGRERVCAGDYTYSYGLYMYIKAVYNYSHIDNLG